MNTYNYKFAVNCPNDGELIIYNLTIESESKVMAEHIKTNCALMKDKHHEDIADYLKSQLPGRHTMTATHQGVDIKTVREVATSYMGVKK